MEIKSSGHIYQCQNYGKGSNDPERKDLNIITFRANEPTRLFPGTTVQEVIRVLINRVEYCDSCLKWEGNREIIYHLRQVLVLHEARALLRKVETGKINPEELAVCSEDGHFIFSLPETLPGSPLQEASEGKDKKKNKNQIL